METEVSQDNHLAVKLGDQGLKSSDQGACE
jgi:hypothetical protein